MEMFVPQVGYNKTKLQILRSHPRYTHSFVSYDNSSTTGLHGPRRCMAQSVRMRKVGCSNPSRDRTKSLKQEVTAPLLITQQQIWVTRSSEMTIINGCPVPQYVWHAKNSYCPIAISARHRSKCNSNVKLWHIYMSEKFSSGDEKTINKPKKPGFPWEPKELRKSSQNVSLWWLCQGHTTTYKSSFWPNLT